MGLPREGAKTTNTFPMSTEHPEHRPAKLLRRKDVGQDRKRGRRHLKFTPLWRMSSSLRPQLDDFDTLLGVSRVWAGQVRGNMAHVHNEKKNEIETNNITSQVPYSL